MNIRWDEITEDSLSHIDKVFKLYDLVFPIVVREPHTIFFNGLHYARHRKLNNFRFLIGFEGEELISFATGHYLEEVNSGFIVYIATNPHARSKGRGSKTLIKMEELITEDAIAAGNSSLNAIILETETEDPVHTKEEKDNCKKRNDFFKRNGFKKSEGISYLQPPLHTKDKAVQLNLFIKNVQKNEQDIKKIIYAIYKEKYYLVNGIDKEVLNNCLIKMELGKKLI
ncbi:GNAT superfamily N-acetyltransferase [Neobacillus niacini]|uniref:GNAT family N-acetyltransferase n=1 Tax=Neobacillus driksii TaxID=3035913 RepID=UPI00277FB406|nr:GNAT family N-acetyltransferase [Neobacillus niacini]MDQ0973966.1 GNAT superfamily N-acetyltransferase [Neobacillus niacini]